MSAVSQAEGEPPDTGHAPGADVLTAERAYLLKSREFLHLMREDVLSLKALGGDPISEEYLKAELYHRAEALKDLPGTPLFFGRLDYRDDPIGAGGQIRGGQASGGQISGETFHIGRRHVHDPGGHPVVIDWRAPVSRPFYRASRAQPMGLELRRRFGFSGGELTAFEDEQFPGGRPGETPAAGTAVTGTEPVSRLLIEEIERPRSGPMRDIVATIQPEQDDIVRADVGQTVCVQGAPGTGKTAVGLHRVAYLLYAYKERVARRGVLVIGPNRAFLAYIRNVLPALGEIDVSQMTVTELAASVPVRGHDGVLSARVKGDARMAVVLRRALWSHLAQPSGALVLPRGSRRWRVSAHDLAGLADELRERGVRYGAGRELLAHRIAHVILTQMEAAGESCDDRTHDAVRRTRVVRAVVDAIWPKVDPVRLVFGLLSSPEALGRGRRRHPGRSRAARHRVGKTAPRSRIRPLVARRRRAHRRGPGPDRAHPEPEPRGDRRGAGSVPDGVPGHRPPVLHRGRDRPRRPRPGHDAVGHLHLGRSARSPRQARSRAPGPAHRLPGTPADPRLRQPAAAAHRARTIARGLPA